MHPFAGEPPCRGQQFPDSLFAHHPPDIKEIRVISFRIFHERVRGKADAGAGYKARFPRNKAVLPEQIQIFLILEENTVCLPQSPPVHDLNHRKKQALFLKGAAKAGNCRDVRNAERRAGHAAIDVRLDRIGQDKRRLIPADQVFVGFEQL